jgi:hypothetical protein
MATLPERMARVQGLRSFLTASYYMRYLSIGASSKGKKGQSFYTPAVTYTAHYGERFRVDLPAGSVGAFVGNLLAAG